MKQAPVTVEHTSTPSGSAFYFNKVAEEYATRYDANTPGGYALRVRQERVLEVLDKRGGKALDVGCGPGKMAHPLLEMGYEFWGVDAAPAMIDLCERDFANTPRTYFSVNDARKLDFADNFFDCVMCTGVIDRVENWHAAFAEMVRVLKPNGTLIISFPNLVSPYAWWKNFIFYPGVALLRPVYYAIKRRSQPPSLYDKAHPRERIDLLKTFARLETASAVTRMMSQAGAHVINVVYYNFTLFLSPLDEIFPQASMKQSESLEHLRLGKLRWLGAGYIVNARKTT